MTAVEWLEDNIHSDTTYNEINVLIEKAKEMEKQQVIDAYVEGGRKGFNEFADDYEQYYNKTYKKA